jgi:23S rRNA G2445 N2-methylase RlmL
MSLWNIRSRIVITCAKGIGPYLKEELLFLGYPILSEGVADIEVEGTMEDAMRLNLLIRTGQHILFFLREFNAKNPDEIYEKMLGIEWEEFIPEDGYLCLTSSVENPTIRDSRFANLKCKDAIVDRMKKKCGRRPDSGPQRDRSVIHLYWKGKQCQVYIDTSGEPLSRRGYRRIPLQAPMQETLAAAVVLASGWKGSRHFINPMCGSGTLAIEATMMAIHKAPGLLRNNYGFMHLKGFKESYWKALRQRAKSTTRHGMNSRVIATDISPIAVEAAKKNAKTAGVDHFIEFKVCEYAETPIPEDGGVVILNPEYGKRLGEMEKLGEVYKGIGDFFKKRCRGYRGYIFTGNLDLAKKVGLRAKKRIPFFNSNIECRLLEYELYEGSRKRQAPSSGHQ